MHRSLRSPSHFRLSLLVALLAWCALLAGCGASSDPLEAIRQQQAAGDFAGSLAPLRELLKERSDDPEVQFLYGRALAMNGQPSLAEWSLLEAMKDPEWLVIAGTELAGAQLRAGDSRAATETTTRVLEYDPENIEVLLMRANARARMPKQSELALEDVERIQSLDPESLEVMEPRILALLNLQREEEAGAAIEELGERIESSGADPATEGWHCATAALFAFESERLEEARERWADCTERFPAHPNVIQNAVAFYDAERDFERSLEVLRRAHEETGSRGDRLNLAGRLQAMGETEEARELLEAAADRVASPAEAVAVWMDLAQHHHAAGDYDEAAQASAKALQAARELGDPSPMVLFKYADDQAIAGHYDAALAAADEIEVVGQREMILARVAYEQGDHARALEHFDAAFVHWPDNAFGRYYAALAAERLGEFDRAIEAYRYAMRLGNDATDAKLRLARILMAQGDTREALETVLHGAQGADRRSVGLEEELLRIQLAARLRQEPAVRQSLAAFQAVRPGDLGRAVAEAALGYRAWGGPTAALRVIRGGVGEGLDLSDPRHAPALRALVRDARELGESAAAKEQVDALLRAHPEAATAQEVLGLWLELEGLAEEADAAYAKALEADAEHAPALLGRARLALARGDSEAALGLYERVLAEEAPEDPPQSVVEQRVEARRGAAESLVATGRIEEAEAQLRELLALRSYDARAAARLAELQLERDAAGPESVALARRAIRFGGGSEAHELLGRVHAARGDAELAKQAAARAQEIRDLEAGEQG